MATGDGSGDLQALADYIVKEFRPAIQNFQEDYQRSVAAISSLATDPQIKGSLSRICKEMLEQIQKGIQELTTGIVDLNDTVQTAVSNVNISRQAFETQKKNNDDKRIDDENTLAAMLKDLEINKNAASQANTAADERQKAASAAAAESFEAVLKLRTELASVKADLTSSESRFRESQLAVADPDVAVPTDTEAKAQSHQEGIAIARAAYNTAIQDIKADYDTKCVQDKKVLDDAIDRAERMSRDAKGNREDLVVALQTIEMLKNSIQTANSEHQAELGSARALFEGLQKTLSEHQDEIVNRIRSALVNHGTFLDARQETQLEQIREDHQIFTDNFFAAMNMHNRTSQDAFDEIAGDVETALNRYREDVALHQACLSDINEVHRTVRDATAAIHQSVDTRFDEEARHQIVLEAMQGKFTEFNQLGERLRGGLEVYATQQTNIDALGQENASLQAKIASNVQAVERAADVEEQLRIARDSNIALDVNNRHKETTIQEQLLQLAGKDMARQAQIAELAGKDATIQQLTTQISIKNAIIAARDTTINLQTGEIGTKNGSMQGLIAQASTKDALINNQQAELDRQIKALDYMRQERDEWKKRAEECERQLPSRGQPGGSIPQPLFQGAARGQAAPSGSAFGQATSLGRTASAVGSLPQPSISGQQFRSGLFSEQSRNLSYRPGMSTATLASSADPFGIIGGASTLSLSKDLPSLPGADFPQISGETRKRARETGDPHRDTSRIASTGHDDAPSLRSTRSSRDLQSDPETTPTRVVPAPIQHGRPTTVHSMKGRHGAVPTISADPVPAVPQVSPQRQQEQPRSSSRLSMLTTSAPVDVARGAASRLSRMFGRSDSRAGITGAEADEEFDVLMNRIGFDLGDQATHAAARRALLALTVPDIVEILDVSAQREPLACVRCRVDRKKIDFPDGDEHACAHCKGSGSLCFGVKYSEGVDASSNKGTIKLKRGSKKIKAKAALNFEHSLDGTRWTVFKRDPKPDDDNTGGQGAISMLS